MVDSGNQVSHCQRNKSQISQKKVGVTLWYLVRVRDFNRILCLVSYMDIEIMVDMCVYVG